MHCSLPCSLSTWSFSGKGVGPPAKNIRYLFGMLFSERCSARPGDRLKGGSKQLLFIRSVRRRCSCSVVQLSPLHGLGELRVFFVCNVGLVRCGGVPRAQVKRISEIMHKQLVFHKKEVSMFGMTSWVRLDFEERLVALSTKLAGFRRSFEYIQDYVSIYGLRVWQEEFQRIINYNVEQVGASDA